MTLATLEDLLEELQAPAELRAIILHQFHAGESELVNHLINDHSANEESGCQNLSARSLMMSQQAKPESWALAAAARIIWTLRQVQIEDLPFSLARLVEEELERRDAERAAQASERLRATDTDEGEDNSF